MFKKIVDRVHRRFKAEQLDKVILQAQMQYIASKKTLEECKFTPEEMFQVGFVAGYERAIINSAEKLFNEQNHK